MSLQNPTVNTLLDKTYLKDLYENPDGVVDWKIDGTGSIVDVDGSYLFFNDVVLTSEILKGADLTLLKVVFNIRTSGFRDIYNYTLRLEYEDGEFEEKKPPIISECPQSKDFPIVFYDIKPKNFRLKVFSAYSSKVNQYIYINSIYVSGINKCPDLEVGIENTAISFGAVGDYDECVVELFRQDPNEHGIDTLFYNDFNDARLGGIVIDGANPNLSHGMLGIESLNDVAVKIPIVPNKNLVNLKLFFKSKKINKIKSDMDLYYNNEFIQTYDHKVVYDFYERECFLDVQHGDVDTLNFILRHPGDCGYIFVCFDEIYVFQECEYSYERISESPYSGGLPMKIPNLDCISHYKVRVQLIDNENALGEKVITSIREFYINTTGDFMQLAPGDSQILDSDFEGSIMMSKKADLHGSYTVLGELCYVLEYIPEQWNSVGLPFRPQRIGAFVNDEGYYLRENYDYYLRQYENNLNTGMYEFSEKYGMEEYEGYILKVPAGLKYDNNAIYIYSPKKTTINKHHKYIFDNLYNHVINPYTYSLNYMETSEEMSELFGENLVYKFDGSDFLLFTSDDEIEPFESVIVYTGGVNGAPRKISIDKSVGTMDGIKGKSYKILVFSDGFIIHDYEGLVRVWSVSGKSVFNDHILNGEKISLPDKGCYILDIAGKQLKVVL